MSTNHLHLFDKDEVRKQVPAGEHLFRAGDPANGKMYVVLSGEAEILVNDVMVELAGQGTVLGEMALIDQQPRSASVRCVSDCAFAEVDEKRFQYLIQQTPYFALEVMRVLGVRLRNTDKLL